MAQIELVIYGSPARAGMDPRPRATRSALTGSPARAGMDPAPGVIYSKVARLPRSRGDGPSTLAGRAAQAGLPRSRGDGPCQRSVSINDFGLPRSRGDGPVLANDLNLTGTAPPLARGWTPRRRACRPACGGSPARAGMDPWRPVGAAAGIRLPRSRGDGPHSGVTYTDVPTAPPLARGWTLEQPSMPDDIAGSPARAGMDPLPACRPRSIGRLPRSRGDGPGSQIDLSYTVAAPPLARGWTLDQKRTTEMSYGLPRSRGDGPNSGVIYTDVPTAPPLARGWTRRNSCSSGASLAAPPLARGWTRLRARAGRPALRLPRSRGDGPG